VSAKVTKASLNHNISERTGTVVCDKLVAAIHLTLGTSLERHVPGMLGGALIVDAEPLLGGQLLLRRVSSATWQAASPRAEPRISAQVDTCVGKSGEVHGA
jgi:hypothetical protein